MRISWPIQRKTLFFADSETVIGGGMLFEVLDDLVFKIETDIDLVTIIEFGPRPDWGYSYLYQVIVVV